jgi:hypothetical protein
MGESPFYDVRDPMYLYCARISHKKGDPKEIMVLYGPLLKGVPFVDRVLRDAYFAGLIDGEGNIGSHSAGRRNPVTGEHQVKPIIQVKMTCEKTIRALHEHFGVGHVVYQDGDQPGWKPSWRWRATTLSARKVAEVIRPYLITKAEDLAEHFPAEGDALVDRRKTWRRRLLEGK